MIEWLEYEGWSYKGRRALTIEEKRSAKRSVRWKKAAFLLSLSFSEVVMAAGFICLLIANIWSVAISLSLFLPGSIWVAVLSYRASEALPGLESALHHGGVDKYENGEGDWCEITLEPKHIYAFEGASPNVSSGKPPVPGGEQIASFQHAAVKTSWSESELVAYCRPQPTMRADVRPPFLVLPFVERAAISPPSSIGKRLLGWLTVLASALAVASLAGNAINGAGDIGGAGPFAFVCLGLLWICGSAYGTSLISQAEAVSASGLIGEVDRFSDGQNWIELYRWTELVHSASDDLVRCKPIVGLPGFEPDRDPDEDESDYPSDPIGERLLTDEEVAEFPQFHNAMTATLVFGCALWNSLAIYGAWRFLQMGFKLPILFCLAPPLVTWGILIAHRQRRFSGSLGAVRKFSRTSRLGFYWYEVVEGQTWTLEGVPAHERIRSFRFRERARCLALKRAKKGRGALFDCYPR